MVIRTKNRLRLYTRSNAFEIDIKVEQKPRINNRIKGKSSDVSECADCRT